MSGAFAKKAAFRCMTVAAGFEIKALCTCGFTTEDQTCFGHGKQATIVLYEYITGMDPWIIGVPR